MKTHPSTPRSRSAFTLIELLTVIAIIAILMGILFPVIQAVIDHARRVRTKTVVQNIMAATNAYRADYGKYPPIAAAFNNNPANGYYSFGESSAGCAANNSDLFNVLRAIPEGPNADHVLNKRQQRYFEDKKATSSPPPREGFADGNEFATGLRGQLLDPWGKQYCIVLDQDGDDMLNLQSFFSDLTTDIRSSSVVFSLAKNGEIGGKDYRGRYKKPASSEAPDDVVSWE